MRPYGGGTHRPAAPLPLSRPLRGSAPATTKRGPLSPAPRAAARPPPPPSPTPAGGHRERPPARPATRDAYLSRLLTGSIFQEPGDEEVELCAGERDGETRAERPRGAGARGRVRPARRPRSARLTRSQLREAFPLTRHVCGSLRGRRRESPPPRVSGDGAAACPVAVSVCSRAEPRLHHSSNGGGGGGGGNNNSQAAAPAAAASAGIPPPQKGVRAFAARTRRPRPPREKECLGLGLAPALTPHRAAWAATYFSIGSPRKCRSRNDGLLGMRFL